MTQNTAARWRRSPDAVWRAVPGYLAVATVDGRVIEVGGPGADIWRRLAAWTDEGDLVAALAREYGAPIETVAADVERLLGELRSGGYVERRP